MAKEKTITINVLISTSDRIQKIRKKMISKLNRNVTAGEVVGEMAVNEEKKPRIK